MEYVSYSLGEPFPEKRFISDRDRISVRVTPQSFDIVMTLTNITSEERNAIVSEKFHASLFVFKQIPQIVFDFGVYKGNVTINIQKIHSINVKQWLGSDEDTITIYLLEEVTGKIINIRFCRFPLMKELKYLLRLQIPLSKEAIDSRIHEGESLYSVPDMLNYSIFYDEIPKSGINLGNDGSNGTQEDEYLF